MRLLDKDKLRLDLQGLGFSSQQLKLFQEKITQPNGIILVELIIGVDKEGKNSRSNPLQLTHYRASVLLLSHGRKSVADDVQRVPVTVCGLSNWQYYFLPQEFASGSIARQNVLKTAEAFSVL